MAATQVPAGGVATAPAIRLDPRLVLAVVVVGLVGATVLPLPFGGDQALIVQGSEAISRGALLYRDFWDLKLPGTYIFYLVAGTIFGFDEVGVHAAELAYLAAFGGVLFLTLRPRITHPGVARLAPLVIVGVYLVGVRPYELGQMEALIGFPLYVSLVCAQRAGTRPARLRWWVAYGIAVGLVGLFKHLYVVIALAFLLRTAWYLVRGGTPWGWLARGLGWSIVGLSLVVLPVTAYFVLQGQLERIIWTYFDYASSIATEARPAYRLFSALGHHAALTAPLAVLAAAALLGRPSRSWGRLRGDMLLWLAIGVPLVMIQSWWAYQFLVLFVPMAVLGVLGLDAIVSRAVAHSRTWLGAAAIASLSLVVMFGGRVLVEARHGFGLTAEQRVGLHEELMTEYAIAAEELRGIGGKDSLAGDLYVIGNPITLYLSGRAQAVPINGWSPELHDARAWAEVVSTLRAARPAEIFVDARYVPLLPRWSPELVRWLASDYEIVRTGPNGSWYHHRDTPGTAPS